MGLRELLSDFVAYGDKYILSEAILFFFTIIIIIIINSSSITV